MPPPKLHVIYAGRGDAMVLECDNPASPQNRMFILVDGGPKNYDSGRASATAPYHRHLWSACQALLGTNREFSAMIFSHPDEDHFGGFVHALSVANQTIRNGTDVFLPNDANSDENARAPIQKICTKAGFTKDVLHSQYGSYPRLAGPVKALFPLRRGILWYHGASPRQRGNDGAYNTGLSKNGRSILMYTDTEGVDDEMGIFFTGDSDADTINTRMMLHFPSYGRRRFAIYKIQHHGSIFDSMKEFYNPWFMQDLADAAFVYVLLKARLNIAYIPNPEKTGPSVKYAADKLAEALVAKYGGAKVGQYYTQLGAVIKKVQQDQLNTLGPKPPPGGIETYIEMPPLDHPLDPDPSDILAQLDNALKGDGNLPDRAEWRKYRDDRTIELMAYLNVRSVRRFYANFKSDVYVVSANFKYSHPRCETLFGLALAIKQQNRPARLYLTNGQSLNMEGLCKLENVMEDGTVPELFYGDHLRVSFLRNGTYMSLDASSQGRSSPVFNINRDLTNMTEEINFNNVQEESRAEMHRRLEEKDKDQLLKTDACVLHFARHDGTILCLFPVYDDDGSIVWDTTTENDPKVTWIDDGDAIAQMDLASNLKCRVKKFDIAFDEFVCKFAGNNDTGDSLWYMSDIEETETFYFENDQLQFGDPQGAPFVKFHIGTAPQHLQTTAKVLGAMSLSSRMRIKDPTRHSSIKVHFPISKLPVSLECSLREAFERMGDPIKDQQDPNFIDVLSRLFRDKPLLVATLNRLPESILRAGFIDLKTDLDASRAILSFRPIGGQVIDSAVLHRPKPKDGGEDPLTINMAKFDFDLRDFVIRVGNCHTSRVYLSVECHAILKNTNVGLAMTWKSSEGETIISFSSTTVAIKDLIGALLGTETDVDRILQGDIPLMDKGSSGDQASSIGNMPGPINEVGFSLRQPIEMVYKYELADIWIRTEFSDWKTFLPLPEKFTNIKGDVLLQIQDPLHLESLRIGVAVKLVIPVPNKPEVSVIAQFCAVPLPRVGDYDYQFHILEVGHGVTVPDIIAAIGLDGVATEITKLPALESVFSTVLVKEVGVSVARENSEWKFKEWAFELSIPIVRLLSDSLAMVDAKLRVEKFQDGEIRARGEAMFRSQELQKEAKVELALPTADDPGYIIFSTPDGLTIGDVFKVFSLGDLQDVPFLGGKDAVRITYCDVKFQKQKNGEKTKVTSFSAKFNLATFEIGKFRMEDIELSMFYQLGEADEDERKTSKPSFAFELLALLQNIKSAIRFKYNGEKNELLASITPIKGFPMKIVDIFSLLIPGIDSALHSSFGELEMEFVEMVLDVKTVNVSSFQLKLNADDTLQLPSADDQKPFALKSVRVEYVRLTSKFELFAVLDIAGVNTDISLLTSADAKLNQSSVEFVIALQKRKKQKTVQSKEEYDSDEINEVTKEDEKNGEDEQDPGLKALLGAAGIENAIIPVPEGCPEINFGLADIKGKFINKDKTGLKLAELSFHVETAELLKAVDDWDIAVDKLYLRVDYNKANTEKPLSALVLGKLTVAQSVEMIITYIDVKDGSEFRAQLSVVKQAEVKVGSVLEWVAGEFIKDELPSFISDAVVNLNTAKFDMSLSRRKGDGKSAITVSLNFVLDSVTVQLARTQIRPDGAKKDDKLPWKTLLRLVVNTLPRPPPLPLVGQIEQPFSTQVYWTNKAVSREEVEMLNTLVTFEKQRLLVSERATKDVVFGQGMSFMLLNNGDIILTSKPKKTTKKDGPSGKSIVILEEESPEAPEAPEMKKFDKRINGVSITNVGLDYDTKGQKIKVKFTARVTIGPMDGELINFTMIIKLPQGEKIELSNWKRLGIEMDLDGVTLAMTGSNLNVAGFLNRIRVEDENVKMEGFEGGVSVKLTKYQFVGFGSYKTVTTDQAGEFVSLMAYAMLMGPMIKTGLVELSGISGGFGFGSKLLIPPITEINRFPLLMDPNIDPMVMFERLRGTSGPKYMTETNGANWVAAGVMATACELVDVSAVLTIPLDPSAGELAIVGTASAQFPREAVPEKSLAVIKINFQGSIDVSRGMMLFEGRIADGSFLLLNNCLLTGGFVVGAWFGTSPQAGDWCISIGGWHPKYQAPAHYPSAPPRMELRWTCGESQNLSIDGQAYAAVTPDALMGGLAATVKYETSSCGASFDLRTDLILWLHPLHYDACFHINACLWYEIDALVIRKKLHVSLGADLSISGPPFGGVAEFNLCVTTIRVYFGERQSKPEKFSFDQFMTVVLKDTEIRHVLSLEAGAVTPIKTLTEAQTPKSPWAVRGGSFAFSITSRVPATSIDFTGAQNPKRQLGERIFARPMHLTADSSGLKSGMDVSIVREPPDGESFMEGFIFEVIYEQLPRSLWGVYDSNADIMLNGASDKSTVTHATGLHVQAPMAQWSSQNPRIIQFSELSLSKPVETSFMDDSSRDVGMDGRPREASQEADFAVASESILGSRKQSDEAQALKTRNGRRASVVSQWMSIRKLKTSSSIKSGVPVRYAKGLARFSHVAPRVSLE